MSGAGIVLPTETRRFGGYRCDVYLREHRANKRLSNIISKLFIVFIADNNIAV